MSASHALLPAGNKELSSVEGTEDGLEGSNNFTSKSKGISTAEGSLKNAEEDGGMFEVEI